MKYEITYEDWIGMKYLQEIIATDEKEAVMKLQLKLVSEGDLMTKLIETKEL
tara:strand:- start:166 stop:321 length:156 start_codon:yes stop_codon:yes gene_type:complete